MNEFKRYWICAAIISSLCILLIGYQWFQVHRVGKQNTVEIRDRHTLQRNLAARDTIEFKNGNTHWEIPTGFFIQSLAFVNSSDVNITGYLWQKYPEDFPSHIKKGIIFPEEVSSNGTTLRQAATIEGTQNGINYKMICWYFDVTVRQSFDYSKYPLDFLTVWLRLWPGDLRLDQQVVLIPDFDAYTDTARDVFGVDADIVQGEWDIT